MDKLTYKRKLRKKKLTVQDEKKELTLDNGTKKIQCNHCKELFATDWHHYSIQSSFEDMFTKEAKTRGPK